jgi:glyoxylase-like metal-dependent hydrolase (beta-lactamase superfamily II)
MTELPLLTLRIPNPFVEGRNRVYVIGSAPLTLIDTGIATGRAFDALVQGLREHGRSLDEVGRVILTHKHIDHIGNAWRIQRQTGAEVLIHESELEAVRAVDPDGRRYAALVRERLDEWKVPRAEAEALGAMSGPMTWEIEPATPTAIVDGQRIDLGGTELEVIHTPGHTTGSVCLRWGRTLFSGDHVLPDISPNVGGGDLRHRGLLRHYLASLERAARLAGDIDRVLPGHGDPFDNLHARCHALITHHRTRLDRVRELLRAEPGLTVHDLAVRLFGAMEGFHRVLGCAEAQAHLEVLVEDGLVKTTSKNMN